MPRDSRVHFIQVDGATVSRRTREARRHAAREFHARGRRRHVMRYQELRTTQETPAPLEQESTALVPRHPSPSPATPLSAALADPFSTGARRLSSFENFLMQHYIQEVLAAQSFPRPSFGDMESYLSGMKQTWVPLALSDPGMLGGIFVTACRNLHWLYGGTHDPGPGSFLEHALRYKLDCITSLNDAISKQGDTPEDATIAKAIILAADEVSIGAFSHGKQHVQAARKMMALRTHAPQSTTQVFLRALMIPLECDEAAEAEALDIFNRRWYFRASDPERPLLGFNVPFASCGTGVNSNENPH